MDLREYLASLKAAKPGDPAGGFLEGQADQLQKLPGAGQGHGGEFVMNAEATKKFRPILEAMNRSVPASKGVKAEKPGKGRAYYAGGDTGEDSGEGNPGGDPSDPGEAAVGVDDPGVAAALGISPAPPGVGTSGLGITGDPGAEGLTPGMSLTAAHGHPDSVTAALTGALSGAIGAVTAGVVGTPPDATTTAVATALSAAGLGPAAALAAGAMTGAANAQTSAISGLTGLTPGEISNAMAAANTAAADAAAGTGAAPGGQGGAEWAWESDREPVALSDYLAWLRRGTQPLRGLRESIYA